MFPIWIHTKEEVKRLLILGAGGFGHMIPVSYTHLDVYKRQPLEYSIIYIAHRHIQRNMMNFKKIVRKKDLIIV